MKKTTTPEKRGPGRPRIHPLGEAAGNPRIVSRMPPKEAEWVRAKGDGYLLALVRYVMQHPSIIPVDLKR